MKIQSGFTKKISLTTYFGNVPDRSDLQSECLKKQNPCCAKSVTLSKKQKQSPANAGLLCV